MKKCWIPEGNYEDTDQLQKFAEYKGEKIIKMLKREFSVLLIVCCFVLFWVCLSEAAGSILPTASDNLSIALKSK